MIAEQLKEFAEEALTEEDVVITVVMAKKGAPTMEYTRIIVAEGLKEEAIQGFYSHDQGGNTELGGS